MLGALYKKQPQPPSIDEKDDFDLSEFWFLFTEALPLDIFDEWLSYLQAIEIKNLQGVDKSLDKIFEDKYFEMGLLSTMGMRLVKGQQQKIGQYIARLVDLKMNLDKYLKAKYTFHNPFMSFPNTTLFKLARFFLDTTLYNFLSTKMNQDDVRTQIKEMQDNGIQCMMTLSSFNRIKDYASAIEPPAYKELIDNGKRCVIINEPHYDWAFSVYKEVVREYCFHASSLHDETMSFLNMPDVDDAGNINADKKLLQMLWQKVYNMQLFFPPVFAQLYCSSLPFDPLPDFNKEEVQSLIGWSTSYLKIVRTRVSISLERELVLLMHYDDMQWPFEPLDHKTFFYGVHREENGENIRTIAGPPKGTIGFLKELDALEAFFQKRKQDLKESCDAVDRYSLSR